MLRHDSRFPGKPCFLGKCGRLAFYVHNLVKICVELLPKPIIFHFPRIFFAKILHISQKSSNFAAQLRKNSKKLLQ